MGNNNWLKYVLAGLAVYLILGLFMLNSQKEGVQGNVGRVWNATERAVEVLGRLEQQVSVFMADRRDIVEQITSARKNLLAAREVGDLQAALQAQQQAGLAINVIMENYPLLDLSPAQTALMDETAGSINRIAYARDQLIGSQVSYNRTRVFFFLLAAFFPRMEVLGEFADPAMRLPPSTFGTPSP